MANQFVTIDSVVRSALADKEESSHLYAKYLRLALKGYKEFHFDHAMSVKDVFVDMLTNNSIELPCDYVDYVKIGVAIGDETLTMTPSRNMNLINPKDEYGNEYPNYDPSRQYDDIGLVDGYWYGMYYNGHGQNLGRKYGNGTHQGYFFTVVKEKEQIQFSSDVICDQVYLKYISTGINASGGTLVHQYAALTIESYIHWRISHFKAPNSGETAALKTDYYDQLRIYRARANPMTPADIKEIASNYYSLSIK